MALMYQPMILPELPLIAPDYPVCLSTLINENEPYIKNLKLTSHYEPNQTEQEHNFHDDYEWRKRGEDYLTKHWKDDVEYYEQHKKER